MSKCKWTLPSSFRGFFVFLETSLLRVLCVPWDFSSLCLSKEVSNNSSWEEFNTLAIGYGCTKWWLENVGLKNHSNNITLHKFHLFECFSMALIYSQSSRSIKASSKCEWCNLGCGSHDFKRHGTTKLLAFNGYGSWGFLVPQPWSTLDGSFGIYFFECGWDFTSGLFARLSKEQLHRSCKLHITKSHKCIKNLIYIVLVLH